MSTTTATASLVSSALASSTQSALTTTTTSSTDTSSDASSSDDAVLGTSSQAIIACNSISVAACVLVLVVYGLLHRKHARLMQRTSLILSCAMAAADLVLHATNLVGYFALPEGFACAFVGGWLYAFPTLLSVFYSCCIAFNSQLYFVFRREPKDTGGSGIGALLKLYIILPIVLSGIICFSALAAGLYGYDSVYGYCWFASPPEDPDNPHQRHLRPLVGMVTTFGGWCLLSLVYLLFASSTVAWVVFWKSSDVDFGGHIGLRRNRRQFTSEGSESTPPVSNPRWAGHIPINSTDMEMQKKGRLHTVEFKGREKSPFAQADDVMYSGQGSPAEDNESKPPAAYGEAGETDFNVHMFPPNPRLPSSPIHSHRIETNAGAPTAPKQKISRRTLALRAMTLRLIGYILIPVFCVLPSVLRDLFLKAYVGEFEFPEAISGLIDGLNGLVGLFNAVLFLVDPVLLILWGELRANRRWGMLQKERTEAQHAQHAAEADPGTPRAGIRSTTLGRSDTPRGQGSRAFDGSLVSDPPGLDHEQRSPGLSLSRPFKIVGRRKRSDARLSTGAGLAIHVQVEVTKYSDLERVEDYLHGL